VTADQPRTAAQHDWDNQQGDFHTIWHVSPVDRTIWQRTQELSAEIAALRDTVAENHVKTNARILGIIKELTEHQYSLDDLKESIILHGKPARESPASAPEPKPCCSYNGWHFKDDDGTLIGRCEKCNPAPEPDPLCAREDCGHTRSEHSNLGAQCGEDDCFCMKFVPQAEPATAHQDPPDAVLLAIRDLYVLTVTSNDYDQMTSRLGRELRYEWERITQPDQEWHSADSVDAAIRAYGRDGAR